MDSTTSPASDPAVRNEAQTFRLMDLPGELRNQIWEDCFWLTLHAPRRFPGYSMRSSHPLYSVLEIPLPPPGSHRAWAVGNMTAFYTRAPKLPAIVLVCRESRAVAMRLIQQEESKFRWDSFVPAFEVSAIIPGISMNTVPEKISGELGGDFVPVLAGHFFMSKASRWHVRPDMGVLQQVLASKDDEIKIWVSDSRETGAFDLAIPSTPLPGEPDAMRYWRQWFRRPVLISIHDAKTWAELNELRNYCNSIGIPGCEDFWEKVGSRSGREEILEQASASLQKIWNIEDERNKAGGGPGLKPLPRIDVLKCLFVSPSGGVRRGIRN
ncbi:hypothetical protein B0T16DRAFT_388457 [Cercophora newfieldiana]|uniref:2EXR domain-containing protein n=1 Tax=Cercophora newfieldiana TaxID=92897 RepID=A0AA40CR64_9PEZI|nr:hypothetical protein B0T16DRAFT_388457 [Cercophora newfieldiana]